MLIGPMRRRGPSDDAGPMSNRSPFILTGASTPRSIRTGWSLFGGALGGNRGTVRSWQGLADEECGHLSFDPTGRFIAASYDMGGALIFGLDDPPGSISGVQPGGSRVVQSRFDPSGRCLATASMGRLAVWPVQRSRRPYTLRGHSGQVDKLEFGPGGVFMVSTGTDGTSGSGRSDGRRAPNLGSSTTGERPSRSSCRRWRCRRMDG